MASKSGLAEASDESESDLDCSRDSEMSLPRSRLICAVTVVLSNPLLLAVAAACRMDRPIVAAAAMMGNDDGGNDDGRT